MSTTTTNVKQVKMNIMTQQQYDQATKDPTEFYMVTDAELYSNFTGATSIAGGAAGLVPAPSAGDNDKILTGGATWSAVKTINSTSLLGSGNIDVLANTATGTNSLTVGGTAAASHYATNIGLSTTAQNDGTSIGYNSKSSVDAVAIGYNATANASNSFCPIAIGSGAQALAGYAIQLGKGTNSTASTFSVGFSTIGNYQLLDGTTGYIPPDRINAVKDQNSGSAKTWTGTLAQYNAITTKDSSTLYYITDD